MRSTIHERFFLYVNFTERAWKLIYLKIYFLKFPSAKIVSSGEAAASKKFLLLFSHSAKNSLLLRLLSYFCLPITRTSLLISKEKNFITNWFIRRRKSLRFGYRFPVNDASDRVISSILTMFKSHYDFFDSFY